MMALTASMEGGCVTKCRISHIKYKWCIENYSFFGKASQDLNKNPTRPKVQVMSFLRAHNSMQFGKRVRQAIATNGAITPGSSG